MGCKTNLKYADCAKSTTNRIYELEIAGEITNAHDFSRYLIHSLWLWIELITNPAGAN